MEVVLVRCLRRVAGRSVGLAVLVTMVGGALGATAVGGWQPVEPARWASAALARPPAPPPNPSDDELRRSRAGVEDRAAAVAALTSRLAELDSRADDIHAELAVQRESAAAALVDLEVARSAAGAAARQAAAARRQTESATRAIDEARARLDEFVAVTYQTGLDLGPIGLLTGSTSPEELVARAELNNLIGQSQLAAQDALERARVQKANADSAAREARDETLAREAAAGAAKVMADDAFAAAQAAARAQADLLAAVDAQRAEVLRTLAAAEAGDAGLRAQRDRFEGWQRRMAAEQAARQRAERDAAAARLVVGREGAAPARGSAAVQRVIDRAMSQLGVQYVWGGGTGRGPSTGIPDAFGSSLDRVGFDCSGLMLYAFNGVGVSLPRVSRNQVDAGRKVPLSEIRPGDLVFYRHGDDPIHHVAMYVGNGNMVEAPYTGASVRVVPLRTKGLLPEATRVI